MKLRHAVLALSWTLVIPQPDTCPKHAETCLHTLVLRATITRGFPTENACWDAAHKWKSDFIRDAEKNNLDIEWPSADDPIQCDRED